MDAQQITPELDSLPVPAEGCTVRIGFSPELVGTMMPKPDRFTRRWVLGKSAKLVGGAFAVGLALKLGYSPQEAKAFGCDCGVHYTGRWSCEYNCRGIRTGRVSFLYAGKSNICRYYCEFWGNWHCDTSACPASNCPNYC